MRSIQTTVRTRTLAAVLCASLAAPLLGGCFFGAAAALTAGSMAAVDRRTVGIQVEDRNIQLKVISAINEKFGDNVHVNTTVYNRQVLLTGEVPDAETRNKVEAAAANVQNVRLLVNDLQVGTHSTFSSQWEEPPLAFIRLVVSKVGLGSAAVTAVGSSSSSAQRSKVILKRLRSLLRGDAEITEVSKL